MNPSPQKIFLANLVVKRYAVTQIKTPIIELCEHTLHTLKVLFSPVVNSVTIGLDFLMIYIRLRCFLLIFLILLCRDTFQISCSPANSGPFGQQISHFLSMNIVFKANEAIICYFLHCVCF